LKACLVLTILIASLSCPPALATPSPTGTARSQPTSGPLTDFVYKLCLKEFPKPKAKEKAEYYSRLIADAAAEADLPASVVASVVWHESNFRPLSVSSCGALGLMQVMPFHFRKGENWRDPKTNLKVGCRVLRGYWLRYDKDPHRALTAYCWGPANVSRGMSRSRYSRAVLGH
jgi:soluble lytic murein transglycosylase-like protein